MTNAMTRLVLIRHGESNGTVRRIVAGPASCTGLSELGRRQAEALRDRLARTGEISPDVLVASSMPRAAETAKIIAPALGGLDVITHDDLREHDPGPRWDGLAYADAVEKIDARRWDLDPYVAGFPGGETVAGFHFRAGTAIHRLIAEHPGRAVVVVCHGGVIDVAIRSMLSVNMVGGFHLWTVNTSLTELTRQVTRPGGPEARWVLRRYNDAAHLDGLPVETPAEP